MAPASGEVPRNDPNPVDLDLLDDLTQIRKELFRDLLEKIKDGKATHQELAISARILKDNGMVLVPPGQGDSDPESRDEDYASELPSFEDD